MNRENVTGNKSKEEIKFYLIVIENHEHEA